MKEHEHWWRAAGLPLVALVGAWLALAPAGPARADCGSPGEIVEADAVSPRLDVELVDGRIVRLAGLDLPDPGRGEPATAAEARKLLAERLVGREARLAVLGPAADRWGRVIGDLVVGPASGESQTSAADALLEAGYARVRPEFETRACATGRLASEDRARAAGLGLWRDPAYRVVGALDRAELERRGGRFAIVEGRVTRVGFGRSRAYLDFGPRGGFSVVAPLKLQAAFARMGRPLGGLTGTTVRARGAIDGRFGPRIEIGEPGMLEFVGRAEARGGAVSGR